jgi:uncharacterized membrane protein
MIITGLQDLCLVRVLAIGGFLAVVDFKWLWSQDLAAQPLQELSGSSLETEVIFSLDQCCNTVLMLYCQSMTKFQFAQSRKNYLTINLGKTTSQNLYLVQHIKFSKGSS